MSRHVLDSYAILAFLQKESGWEQVRSLLYEAAAGNVDIHMSLLNVAEVQYIAARRGEAAGETLAAFQALPIQIHSVDLHIAHVVALKTRYAISLADCFAAVLAQDLDCPLITGDPEFRKLEGVIRVEWLR